MPELGSSGSVRGALRNERPYRERYNPRNDDVAGIQVREDSRPS
jgi:hypothetical protein